MEELHPLWRPVRSSQKDKKDKNKKKKNAVLQLLTMTSVHMFHVSLFLFIHSHHCSVTNSTLLKVDLRFFHFSRLPIYLNLIALCVHHMPKKTDSMYSVSSYALHYRSQSEFSAPMRYFCLWFQITEIHAFCHLLFAYTDYCCLLPHYHC